MFTMVVGLVLGQDQLFEALRLWERIALIVFQTCIIVHRQRIQTIVRHWIIDLKGEIADIVHFCRGRAVTWVIPLRI